MTLTMMHKVASDLLFQLYSSPVIYSVNEAMAWQEALTSAARCLQTDNSEEAFEHLKKAEMANLKLISHCIEDF